MTHFHPAWLEHQRKRFTRPDAYRFAAPGTPEAKPPGWLDPSATRVRWKEAQEEEARAAFAAEVKRLQAEQDRLRQMLAEINYDLAWRKLCRKYGYNPDQRMDRKWDGQPHDELGRFDFGKKPEAQTADEDAGGEEEDSASVTPAEIIATAKRENLAARPDKYMKCLDLCYPLLERRKPPGSDVNTWDFIKCMNACMAREPL